MIERGDHHVLSEPFSHAYYDGPRRRSQRYAVSRPDATVARIEAEVMALAEVGPAFVKDMAYHAAADLDAAFLDGVTNAFLIRDPARTIPSLAAHWPDFTDDEVGVVALDELVRRVDELERDPVIVDSDDLRGDPAGTVASWCDAVGVPFLAEALTWDPGPQPGWERWADWHTETSASSGFLPREGSAPPAPATARVADAIAAVRSVYDRLRARRLRPS